MVSNDIVIDINYLTKRYGGSRGVTDISLNIAKGEIFGFLGPNGAGKSTTINCMLGSLQPTSGTISIEGQDVGAKRVSIVHNVGYLSGDMETEPALTGNQYIEYCMNLRGMRDATRAEELKILLQAEFDKKIKHMSRGNKQKVGLVAALMHDPDILILDEPTSGLDPLMQATFNDIIKDHAKRGKTAFISSHILSEVEEICDRVGFIRDGKLVDVDTIDNLRAKASKKIVITASKPAVLQRFLHSLQGVGELTHADKQLAFSYTGDINELIKLLAKQQIQTLTISNSDLEEMFMEYYRGADDV